MLLFAVMMSVSMSAEVLFSEDFSVGVGTLVESNNGWFTPYDGASGVSITNGLEFPDYVMSGGGQCSVARWQLWAVSAPPFFCRGVARLCVCGVYVTTVCRGQSRLVLLFARCV